MMQDKVQRIKAEMVDTSHEDPSCHHSIIHSHNKKLVMDQLSQADVRYLGVLVNHLAARITEGCLGVCTRQPEIPVSWS